MRVLVAISIFDRKENLLKWIHCWNSCKIENSNLLIVHNRNGENWSQICKEAGVLYIQRNNIGYETGIIQELFLNKLPYKWDVLIFCTDDTLPMKQDFIYQYIEEINKEDVGLVCMEMSGVYTPHVRTTGFAIKRSTASKIHFHYNPILNKDQCYHFEHQGGELTLTSQVLRLGLRIIQPSILKNSILWDTHHNHYLNRWEEWYKEFPGYK